MNEEEQLLAALKQLGHNPSGVFPAKVKEVSDEVIDVIAFDGTEYLDVQLKATINGNPTTTPLSKSVIAFSLTNICKPAANCVAIK